MKIHKRTSKKNELIKIDKKNSTTWLFVLMKRIKNGKRTALGGGPRGIDKYDDEVDGVDAHIHFFLVDDVIRFRVFFSFFLSFFSRFFFWVFLRLGFRMKWKQRLGACYQ